MGTTRAVVMGSATTLILDYFLTDVLAVGLEGQYYVKDLREPYLLVPSQARRLPTVNKYNYGAALNFHYVPIYGKFAILDEQLATGRVRLVAVQHVSNMLGTINPVRQIADRAHEVGAVVIVAILYITKGTIQHHFGVNPVPFIPK